MTLSSSLSSKLFFSMLLIRRVEETIVARYQEKKMRCPVHLSIGQEGIAVGVCNALEPSDQLIGNHRSHAHYLAKGGDLPRMIAEIYGKATGCCLGRGGSMHLIDINANMYGSTPIVGNSIPIGVGLSFADKLQEKEIITVIFFGEGATEEGAFTESINFAALKELPVLFVCENNGYSVYSPLSVRQSPNRDCSQIAKAHGIYVDSGKGNDVEETYNIAKKATSHIRSKKGPAYIELSTYRFREHCGPDCDAYLNYRPKGELEKWKKQCPISLYRDRLLNEKRLTEEDLERFTIKAEKMVKSAFDFAENSPFPEFDLDKEIIYAD